MRKISFGRPDHTKSPSYVNRPVGRTLTWSDKIYLRRVRQGQTLTQISKELGVGLAKVSRVLKLAAGRFDVKSFKELLDLPEVIALLDEE